MEIPQLNTSDIENHLKVVTVNLQSEFESFGLDSHISKGDILLIHNKCNYNISIEVSFVMRDLRAQPAYTLLVGAFIEGNTRSVMSKIGLFKALEKESFIELLKEAAKNAKIVQRNK